MEHVLLATNLETIHKMIQDVCSKCGRDPNTIQLVAVSKKKPPSLIRTAYNLKQKSFGENYVQEFSEKQSALSDLDIKWHFIGHLQSNKAKDIVSQCHLIHSVDRLSLATKLNSIAKDKNQIQNILLQVKIAEEDTKSGCPEEQIEQLVKEIADLPHLKLIGLMGMASLTNDKKQIRTEFRKLKILLDTINKKQIYPNALTELSMGMTHDFDIAIEEGSTLLRIGSAIFGERQ